MTTIVSQLYTARQNLLTQLKIVVLWLMTMKILVLMI